MEKYSGEICPNILKKVNKQQQIARNCFVRWCGGTKYEVDYYINTFVVDLQKKTCTCGLFQFTAYPCPHACSAIAAKRSKLENYVDDCYKKACYLKAYEEVIHVVPGARDYINTTYQLLQPPKIKKKLGRPKKMRKKGPDEVQTSNCRKGLSHTCNKCFEVGYNKKSCKTIAHPKSKFYQGPTQYHDEVLTSRHDAPPLSQDGAGDSQPQTQPFKNKSASQQVGYEGRRNVALLGRRNPDPSPAVPPPTVPSSIMEEGASTTIRSKNKRSTITEVLQNIRDRSRRRPWRP
ncbi:UNVERIFIED_CONTAM: hypothetical protein Sradi_3630100 [Sesamum radiatum]|uniref:SWIM-type domain-containing protein n=1 Tax=Sesamum radiatum TaxID=300843 RepID=A0AAW2QHT3_SESRA